MVAKLWVPLLFVVLLAGCGAVILAEPVTVEGVSCRSSAITLVRHPHQAGEDCHTEAVHSLADGAVAVGCALLGGVVAVAAVRAQSRRSGTAAA